MLTSLQRENWAAPNRYQQPCNSSWVCLDIKIPQHSNQTPAIWMSNFSDTEAWELPHSQLQGCYILTPGAADANDWLISHLKTTWGWNLKVPNMETLDNSEEPFRLQSSLRNLAETRCQQYPHLALPSAPTQSFPSLPYRFLQGAFAQ